MELDNGGSFIMPIYEYYCESCGHEFETLQRITDEPIRKCEKCGKMKAKRSISRTSFVLKGSGWYVTDYGGKNASRGVPGDGSSSSSEKKESSGDSSSSSDKGTDGKKKAANA